MNNKYRVATAANRTYLVAVILFLIFSLLLGLVLVFWPDIPEIPQYFLSYVPAILGFGGMSLLFMLRYGEDMPRSQKTDMSQVMRVLLMTVCGYLSVIPLNAIGLMVSEALGMGEIPQSIPEAHDALTLIFSLLIFSLLPGIVEEWLFRGILQRANARVMGKKAVFFAALAFTLMHGQFHSILALFMLGLYIGWILEATQSLKLCMIYHAAHNAIGIVLGFLMTVLGANEALEAVQESAAVPTAFDTIIALALYVMVAAGMFCIVRVILQSLRKHAQQRFNAGQESFAEIEKGRDAAEAAILSTPDDADGGQERLERLAQIEQTASASDIGPNKTRYGAYIVGIVLSVALVAFTVISLLQLPDSLP